MSDYPVAYIVLLILCLLHSCASNPDGVKGGVKGGLKGKSTAINRSAINGTEKRWNWPLSWSTIFGSDSEPKPPKSPITVSRCGNKLSKGQEVTKIVGGREALLGEFPWQVSLQMDSFFGNSKNHYCGASILNPRWMITAAHCMSGTPHNRVTVTVGIHNLRLQTWKSTSRVEKVIIHEGYIGVMNDIALIRVQTPFDLSRASKSPINGVCLPAKDEHFNGKVASVSGWGKLREGGPLSDTLQAVEVPLMSDGECRKYYPNQIEDSMICAGQVKGGKDACQGDSGGPLVVYREGRAILVGIVSWGKGCARPGFPGVYTEVSKFTDWIEKHAV